MDRKMNVLLLGNSGAGKSTLITAVSGKYAASGAGEPMTGGIGLFESDIWPFRFIDTKGFEPNLFEQMKTVMQVRSFAEKMKKDENGEASNNIDAVWYCIEGTSRRVFSDNIKIMNSAVASWKNVPVFVVITKSYSKADIDENVEIVRKIFSKCKGVNLRGIFPVVAEQYKIDDEYIVEPMGLEELCLATADAADEALAIGKQNRDKMILGQKEFTSHAITAGCAAVAAGIGFAPISIADSTLLVPLESFMTKKILEVYDVRFNKDTVAAIVNSAAITVVAKAIIGAIKVDIATQVLNAVVAGVIVFVLGEGIIALSEMFYNGTVAVDDVNKITDTIEKFLKNNPIIGKAMKYIENHQDEFKGMDAKKILGNVIDYLLSKK